MTPFEAEPILNRTWRDGERAVMLAQACRHGAFLIEVMAFLFLALLAAREQQHVAGAAIPAANTDTTIAGRVVVVGDVHGCVEELREVLTKAGISLDVKTPSKENRVVLVGDLVSKGPYPVETIRLARHAGFDVVVGNHEDALVRLVQRLRRLEHEPHLVQLLEADEARDSARVGPMLAHRLHVLCESSPKRSMKAMCRSELFSILHALNENDLEWLDALPTTITLTFTPTVSGREQNIVILHGGADPALPLTAQSRKTILTARNVLKGGGIVDEKEYDPSVGVPWASLWPGPEHVVFGHDSRKRLQRWPHATGIDTGCVYGGNLTALILPSWEIISVRCPDRSLLTRQSEVRTTV